MKKKIISYINLKAQWRSEKKKLLPIIDKSFSTGDWVGGNEIEKFEKNISKVCNTKYALALNSGTDALTFGLYMLGVRRGDEVITVPNSFIASVAAIVHIGAKPVFVDVLPDQNIDPNLIERVITKKTKAIMPVHLTGRIAEMDNIINISKKYKIPIIEDAAQAVGSLYKKNPAGSFGEVGCFSAHPLKNLNALGDGGYLTTNNKKIYNQVKDLRNHGMTNRDRIFNFGHVSRMDNFQAAVLNYRLTKLKEVILKRRKNASLYCELLDKNSVFIPEEKNYQFNSYHTFVIQVEKRDKLKKFLKKNGILTSIHYPMPIHLQPAASKLGYKRGSFKQAELQAKKIITLPINQFLSIKNIEKISNFINKFFE